jgi:hypothetical protein
MKKVEKKVDNTISNLVIGNKKYRILTKLGLRDSHAMKIFGDYAQDDKKFNEASDMIIGVAKGLIVNGTNATKKWYQKAITKDDINITDGQALDIINGITAGAKEENAKKK